MSDSNLSALSRLSFSRRSALAGLTGLGAVALAGCQTGDGGSSDDSSSGGSDERGEFPRTIKHAFGETEIESAPERVATVSWANQDAALALGVVPVGMPTIDFGGNENGSTDWFDDKLEEVGGEAPEQYSETDGIDFDAIAALNPDVILGVYSGLTQEDYDTLSKIAPTVAYPEGPWATEWDDVIRYNAAGMNMADEGEALIDELQQEIDDSVARYPDLAGTKTMFLTHVDTTDLSTVNFYTANDTRAAFFENLGLATPDAVAEASESGEFSGSVSAEQVDVFDDVELIVTYGDQELVDTLKADPVLSQMPAIENDAIVLMDGSGPMGTAANPTPLSISWVLDDYVDLLAEAAGVAGE